MIEIIKTSYLYIDGNKFNNNKANPNYKNSKPSNISINLALI